VETKPKRRFFAKHAKSSAMMVSLIVHFILIAVAVSFVAVTVINKEDQHFEAKKVARPKVPLKKLQVPVNIKKKKTQKPKLRKRIVVKPKLDQKIPDIKMPEITGVKGGIGSAGDSLGGGGSLGFTMPEINIFGLKSRGEKVFLVLDCGPGMMADARGGIPAYNLIKNELLTIVDHLPPTTLFNLAVYSKGGTYVLFPKMHSATPDHVAKARAWLGPLNQFKPGMGNAEYGPKTLGPGGTATKENLAMPPLKNSSYWLRPALMAMQQQADAIYVLTESWGALNYVMETFQTGASWDEDDKADWQEAVVKARQMFDEENRQRRAKGLPPKVLGSTSSSALVKHYLPRVKHPPKTVGKKKHGYSPAEIEEGMKAVRAKHATGNPIQLKSGVSKKRSKDQFSFNVIHFTTKADNAPIGQFKKLTNELRGDYLQLEGLDAIRFKSSAAPEAVAQAPQPEPVPAQPEPEKPQAPPAQPDPVPVDAGSSIGDAIVGTWEYVRKGSTYSLEFGSDGVCILRSSDGKEHWQVKYTVISPTTVNVSKGKGGLKYELLPDGTLKGAKSTAIRK
jgi:hypothetical protein